MQKKLLAAVVASLVAGQAMALEVYNDDVNSLSIGGKIAIKGVKSNGSEADLADNSPRINFKFAHKFDSGWTGSAVAEWGFYAVDGNEDDQFFNRLGNLGLAHDQFGAFTVGKSWSTYYDVAGWTDVFAIGGGAASGAYDGRSGDARFDSDTGRIVADHDSGDTDGTARADDVVQYRNSFGGLNVGVQYQLGGAAGDFDRDDSYGLSASYDLPIGLSLGVAYNETKYKQSTTTAQAAGLDNKKAKATIVGAKYEAESLYLAATYGMYENKTNVNGYLGSDMTTVGNLDEESSGIELYGKFGLPMVKEGFSLQAGYNQLSADKNEIGQDTEAEFKDYMVGAIYETGPMEFAVQYTRRDETDSEGKDGANDTYAVAATYYF